VFICSVRVRSSTVGPCERFAQALAERNLEGLVAVLEPDVVWTSDGGQPRAQAAGRGSGGWAALSRKSMHEPIETTLNRRLGPLLPSGDGHRAALSFVVSDGRIARIHAIRNPEEAAGPLKRSTARSRAARCR
jgi:RNA polymerase sigma-70 factor (ECF subfamily)